MPLPASISIPTTWSPAAPEAATKVSISRWGSNTAIDAASAPVISRTVSTIQSSSSRYPGGSIAGPRSDAARASTAK